jgi:hypothetical protein
MIFGINEDYLGVIRIQVGLGHHVQACAWSAYSIPFPLPNPLTACPQKVHSFSILLFPVILHTFMTQVCKKNQLNTYPLRASPAARRILASARVRLRRPFWSKSTARPFASGVAPAARRIFLGRCVHARQVLVQTLSNLNIAIAAPRSTCRLESWRQRARQGFSKKTRGNLGALVILGSWSLWKNRNVWVFGNMPNKECSAALKPNLQ